MICFCLELFVSLGGAVTGAEHDVREDTSTPEIHTDVESSSCLPAPSQVETRFWLTGLTAWPGNVVS